MRLGLLADVHGNLDALRAVLAVLRRQRVGAFVCAGDLVGYGPFPNECVEVVADLGAACVAGNHDLMALGLLSDSDCIPLARETMAWTRNVLQDEARGYLAKLPLRTRVEQSIVVAHGSLDDPRKYVVGRRQATDELERLENMYPDADLLVLGHTHVAAVVGRRAGAVVSHGAVALLDNDRYLLNPGSVGQSRERAIAARCAVLDLERRSAEFLAVPYDVDRCRRALRQHGLPQDACHLRPPRLPLRSPAVRELARTALRTARRARLRP
jgi:predicted phosphodiesterase